MNENKIPLLRIMLLSVLIFSVTVLGICDFFIPKSVIAADGKAESIGGIINIEAMNGKSVAKLFGIPLKEVKVYTPEISEVYLGGDAIGVKFYMGGVIVVGLSSGKKELSAAEKAGLAVGDIITEAGGKKVETVEKMKEIIAESKGNPLEISYRRAGEKKVTSLTAKKDGSGAYKAGMWIRDSTAGIGTVSYVMPDGIFASLGHGITDIDTGVLMPLSRGSSVGIEINDAIKGKNNAPGELQGTFSAIKNGVLICNKPTGLYGSFEKKNYENRELIKLGTKSDVHVGKAEIVSTVSEKGPQKFDIEIAKIVRNSDKSKNFVIKVTDERLIEATGGIVQGMSGSPIIQDGKLVGAVTHVTVSDPEKGFGIFIENMLENTPKCEM